MAPGDDTGARNAGDARSKIVTGESRHVKAA
jgi:hypothetical protein